MGFLWFGRKKSGEKEHKEIKNTLENIKKDFGKSVEWIKHLHKRDGDHELSLQEINARLSTVESDISEIKSFISFFGARTFKQVSKQTPTSVYKQTGVGTVQMPVQTAVQIGLMRGFTMMERAVVWVLLNTDMKLSYEDIAAILGKDKSTVRGQINNIKQKSEGLLTEVIEKTGKKRYYMEEKVKEMLFKTIKVKKRPEILRKRRKVRKKA